MGFTGKPSAAFGAAGGSHGRTPAQQTLVSLLEMAYGSVTPALAAVEVGLALAGRDELPLTGPEVLAFVRAHMVAKLTDDIGPRLTMALLDDLVARLDPTAASPAHPTVPPSSMPRPIAHGASAVVPRREATRLHVLLVDGDRVGRTAVARALLRAKWQVTVVEGEDDLRDALASGEPVDAAIVDAQHPSAQAIVQALAAERRQVTVVARTSDATRARELLAHLGIARWDVRSRDAPAEELIEAVRRAWEGDERA